MKEKTTVIVLSSPEGLHLSCCERSAPLQAQGRTEHTVEKRAGKCCCLVITHVTNLATHHAPYRRMEECCDKAFRSLCPLTEINRHCVPERCLLEVNTLNILIIFIPHFLTAKSWFALPPCAVVASRWDAYVHSPLCVLGRARCSTALTAPGSPSGNRTHSHPMVPEKQAQLFGGWDWRPAFLLISVRSTSGTAMLLSSKHKNFYMAHLPHPEAFCSAFCKYRSSAASKFHRTRGQITAVSLN